MDSWRAGLQDGGWRAPLGSQTARPPALSCTLGIRSPDVRRGLVCPGQRRVPPRPQTGAVRQLPQKLRAPSPWVLLQVTPAFTVSPGAGAEELGPTGFL